MFISFCGDVNLDGMIEEGDKNILEENYGSPNCPALDLNRDGVVDEADRDILVSNIGRCYGDVNVDNTVNALDRQIVLNFITQHGEDVC